MPLNKTKLQFLKKEYELKKEQFENSLELKCYKGRKWLQPLMQKLLTLKNN